MPCWTCVGAKISQNKNTETMGPHRKQKKRTSTKTNADKRCDHATHAPRCKRKRTHPHTHTTQKDTLSSTDYESRHARCTLAIASLRVAIRDHIIAPDGAFVASSRALSTGRSAHVDAPRQGGGSPGASPQRATTTYGAWRRSRSTTGDENPELGMLVRRACELGLQDQVQELPKARSPVCHRQSKGGSQEGADGAAA